MKTEVEFAELDEFDAFLWVKEKLIQLEHFVRCSTGGEDFIDLIEFLKKDNEQWCNPTLLKTTKPI